MVKRKPEIQTYRERERMWSARGSTCPLCGNSFQALNCPHNVQEVEERLQEDIIRAIVRDELKKLLDV